MLKFEHVYTKIKKQVWEYLHSNYLQSKGKIQSTQDHWEQVENYFKGLEPEKRIAMFEKLLQYSLPRLQATQLTIPDEPKIQMTDEERKAEIAELKKKLFEAD